MGDFDDGVDTLYLRTTRRFAVAGTLFLVTVALTAASCAGRPGSGQPPPPPGATDPVALTRHVACPQRQAPVPRERLAAFHAVTAVTCGEDVRTFPGDGQWQVSVRRVATGGVPALQAAFELPNEPSGKGPCTLELVVVPPVTLVDGRGDTLTPVPPTGRCNKPPDAFMQALHKVAWRDDSVRKVRQLVTPQAQAADCAMQWKNELWLAGSAAHASRGGPVFAHPPATVHVCIYQTTGTDLEVGTFQSGFALDAAQTRILLAALTGPGPTGRCAGQRRFAVISTDAGPWLNVELGGCWRTQRPYPDHGVGTADASVLAPLLRVR
jgi:hypothetical protein